MKKDSKTTNIIKIIVISVVALLLYLFVSCLVVVSSFFKTIKENNNKEQPKYYVDYDKKLEPSDILIKLSEKYNTNFEIVSVTKEKLQECKSNWFDSYSCKDILIGKAFDYKYVIKSRENIYFNLEYKDPYYIQRAEEKDYHDIRLDDDYVEWVKINEPSNYREMLNRVSNYYNELLSSIAHADIYYFTDNANGPNHIKLYIVTSSKLEDDSKQKLTDYFHNSYSEVFNNSCDQIYGKYFCDYDIVISNKSES